MELALRVLIAAALLSSVHVRAAAVQENYPPSQAQAAAARDINALVRQVLTDRIPAKDIPGLGGTRSELPSVPTASGCPSDKTRCQNLRATSFDSSPRIVRESVDWVAVQSRVQPSMSSGQLA